MRLPGSTNKSSYSSVVWDMYHEGSACPHVLTDGKMGPNGWDQTVDESSAMQKTWSLRVSGRNLQKDERNLTLRD
jgi:hypothetical protein